jgi:hypothetical protein
MAPTQMSDSLGIQRFQDSANPGFEDEGFAMSDQ